MCVIMYKKEGLSMPSLKILKEAWDKNSHGAGIMIKRNNPINVSFIKGLMSFSNIEHILYEGGAEDINLYKDCEVAIHFRIKSHGGINSFLTHPFEVDNKITKFMNNNVTKPLLMHNGIFNICTNNERTSDTSLIAEVILPNINNTENQLSTLKLLAGNTNKIIIIFPNDKPTELIGSWEDIFKDGILWSNNYFYEIASYITNYYNNSTFNKSYSYDSNWNTEEKYAHKKSKQKKIIMDILTSQKQKQSKQLKQDFENHNNLDLLFNKTTKNCTPQLNKAIDSSDLSKLKI